MKIAVVGSGISGLTASLVASTGAHVTLYEKESRIGGHAYAIQTPDAIVDTGFMVFNPPRYPVFCALLEYLNVPSVPTTMSFSVSMPGFPEYASHSARGLFATRATRYNLAHYKFLVDIFRFCSRARTALKTGIPEEMTLGEFLRLHGFYGAVVDGYLRPMLAAIWSCGTTRIDDFPALATFRFLDNHLLLQPWTSASWRTLSNTSAQYVSELEKKLLANNVRIRRNTSINRIVRDSGAVTIHADSTETYDHVIIATHADTALALLEKPSSTEKDILGAFTYSENQAVLHSDTSFMPTTPTAWASWNFSAADRRTADTLTVTYNMNFLQHVDARTPRFVTLNPLREIDSKNVFARIFYSHPKFDLPALTAQKRLTEIQGKNRTLFAGAHWGYGFHEDGAVSGLAAAQFLGFKAPWK